MIFLALIFLLIWGAFHLGRFHGAQGRPAAPAGPVIPGWEFVFPKQRVVTIHAPTFELAVKEVMKTMDYRTVVAIRECVTPVAGENGARR